MVPPTLRRPFPLDQCVLTNGKLNPTNQEAPSDVLDSIQCLGIGGLQYERSNFSLVSQSQTYFDLEINICFDTSMYGFIKNITWICLIF